MPRNSLPDHVEQYQAMQRRRLERFLEPLAQQAEQFEGDLAELDPQSDVFSAKRQWCDGWGAMSRGLLGLLKAVDRISKIDPKSAGELINHGVNIANGMIEAENLARDQHDGHVKSLIPTIQAETRTQHTTAARERLAADQRWRVEKRREMVSAIVSAIPPEERPAGADKLTDCILMDLRNALVAAGLDKDIPHGRSTVRKDIVDLGLA